MAPPKPIDARWLTTRLSKISTVLTSALSRRVNVPGAHDGIYLERRPFNHLGVWSYLAIGCIVLTISTVTAYCIYSCCYKARKNALQQRVRTAASRTAKAVHQVDSGRPRRDKIGPESKDYKDASERGRQNDTGDIERKAFGFGFGHRKKESESKVRHLHSNCASLLRNPQHRMLDAFGPTAASRPSLARGHDPSFDLESAASFNSPPLAHISDRSTSYFNLPPDVSSRSRGPSPATYDRGEGSRVQPAGLPSVKFDSNNIRFVPPLHPFMTKSTVKLWNEPKLSPIRGSIITPTSGGPILPPDDKTALVLNDSRMKDRQRIREGKQRN